VDLTVLIIGVVEVLAMAGLAAYGAAKLPPDARVSLHLIGRYGNFSSRRAGLVAWPVLGAILFVLLGTVAVTVQVHGKLAGFSPGIFLPLVLCIVLLSEVVAIDRSRRAAEDSAPVAKPATGRSRAAEPR
jgi:hypothetical protein